MRSPNYYKVRRVVRITFALSLLAGLYYVSTHINWVGDGYCWGTIDKCYPVTIGGK
jgi:predicted secreted protein